MNKTLINFLSVIVIVLGSAFLTLPESTLATTNATITLSDSTCECDNGDTCSGTCCECTATGCTAGPCVDEPE